MKKQVHTNRKLDKKDRVKMFLRSFLLQGSWNFERLQGLGFCFSISPIIKKLYKEEDRKRAMKRHLELFNTQPYMASSILGIIAALEEKRASGEKIDDNAINGLKIGLMGPFAGIGDPIFWGGIRPLIAALGAAGAITGSLIGPILFFIIFNLIRLGFMWITQEYAYKKGKILFNDMSKRTIKLFTEGVSIAGLFVLGAIASKWTILNVPIVLSKVVSQTGQVKITTLQSILNQIFPGVITLLGIFLCLKLFRKKINATWIIIGIFIIGIIGYMIGFLSLPA